MQNFLEFYQHIPEHLSPIAFRVGSFSFEWYGLMYLAAFAVVYGLLLFRLRRAEQEFSKNLVVDFLLYAFLGLIIGARLGYVLFYNLPFFLHNPWQIISPFDSVTGKFIGIYGMSYHGGVIGVILTAYFFCRKRKIDFWEWSEFIIPAIPAGYFFGRIGNFLNGELYGRLTQKAWGMYFYVDNGMYRALELRHPSQLYEAFFEGLMLFLFLWFSRNREELQGKILPLYLCGYAFFRFLIEFFREPDEQIGLIWNYFTLGQVLCFFMLAIGLVLIWKNKKKGV